MKEKTCCFTGHREIPSGQRRKIFARTEEAIEGLIKKGYLYFGAGGALGFDTIAAFAVLKLKERYPDIRLILVLPCLSQTRGWSQEDIEIYEDIKQKADKVVYTSQEYYEAAERRYYFFFEFTDVRGKTRKFAFEDPIHGHEVNVLKERIEKARKQ